MRKRLSLTKATSASAGLYLKADEAHGGDGGEGGGGDGGRLHDDRNEHADDDVEVPVV